jgi:lipopolysaccharide heptosyltransferase II
VKILLVRLREIGDVVFTTPAIRAVRARFPDAQLSYIVEPAAEPVVRHNPHLSHVIVAPRMRGFAGIRADLALSARLRRERYDIAIDFHGGPRASLFTWLSRAPVRIGYDIRGRGWMYTRRVSRPRELRARHSVENQWDLLESLGVGAANAEEFPVEMRGDAAAAAAVDERLAGAGVQPGDRLVVMHVSAGNLFRRWPAASFGEVAAALATSVSRARVVITSGPSDAGAAAHVIDAARGRLSAAERSRVLAYNEFSLLELRALLERAAVYIGGDSGPMHVAATSRVPIVALYGPTLPARSSPWRPGQWRALPVEVAGLECRPCDQRVCTPGDFRCLTWIQPAQVVAAAERLLKSEADWLPKQP